MLSDDAPHLTCLVPKLIVGAGNKSIRLVREMLAKRNQAAALSRRWTSVAAAQCVRRNIFSEAMVAIRNEGAAVVILYTTLVLEP